MEVLEIEEKENVTYPNFVVHDLISAAENDYITMRGVLILLGSNIT